ncbi:zinc finger protein 333 [Echinococcus multilocularis]|uniref:Zinc finger protein 333 n=1 Tax=Echinococcus multilocularis TaxID=6211 RepID=A0A068Y918_ECHMU|nr:zinc finger protein 333 [Echinococcus multilocularis]
MWADTQLSHLLESYAPPSSRHYSNTILQMLSITWTNLRSYVNPTCVETVEDVEEKALDLSIRAPPTVGTASSTQPYPSSSMELTTFPCSSSIYPFVPFNSDQDLSCPLCKKSFRFEKNLLRHLQKTHAAGSEESILKCKLCAYTTRHYSNMYVHIRTHTGDKPYSCSGCGASFTQGSSLKLHIRSRHDENMAFFSLSRKPGKNNLTKLWTRVVRLDANINLPVSQSSFYILPPQQLMGLPFSTASVNVTADLPNRNIFASSSGGGWLTSTDHYSTSQHKTCGVFSVEALASSPPLQNSSMPKSESLG